MRCVVTGCAGFIGSHLAEKLLEAGHSVIGIDSFSDYYDKQIKKHNIKKAAASANFMLIEGDILNLDLDSAMYDVELIFHQAAQPGVRQSWGTNFGVYVHDNIMATQKILEFVKEKKIKKLIYASSSSVYGDTILPMKEDNVLKPVSPYGVTKLAAENLCYLYWKNYGVPVVSLRYFTVYGPRQRPDMAFHKFVKSILKNEEIIIYGNGEQSRDFTYIADIIDANMKAVEIEVAGEVFNLGGGAQVSVNEILKMLAEITGKTPQVKYIEEQKGDVKNTRADISKANKILGYEPKMKLAQGLQEEVNWIKRVFGL
ncbi:MAG: NAD-dependent epimerase/dehydratase family protein [bacterium]